jgi:hypothetical protein
MVGGDVSGIAMRSRKPLAWVQLEPDLTELVTTLFTVYSNLICYIAALTREDRKDREENIIMGFVAVIHARSYAGFHP